MKIKSLLLLSLLIVSTNCENIEKKLYNDKNTKKLKNRILKQALKEPLT